MRKDLQIVAEMLPRQSRVLDLGCGDGELLEFAFKNQGCSGTGVEIEPDAVLSAISRGIPVIEADI
ncbi:MAG: methionine biosynthesis protein MetW, partial [Propionibacteriaceae bacterium]|nr:methionine biosynthesis protein MetW [Propionibacteriaceae bacterium]